MEIKKIVSLFLAIVLCFCFSMHTLGAVGEDNIVAPYYVSIAGIVPSIDEEDGNLYASISVVTLKTCSIEITMSVQRSAHGTSWSTYASYPKVTLNTGGSRTTSRTLYDVPGGYYYRTYGIIKVYVNGTLTDSETIESDPIYVSILNN